MQKYSPWNYTDDPRDVAVQVSVRMPFWYREKIQALAPHQSVAQIMLDLVGRHVSAIKDSK